MIEISHFICRYGPHFDAGAAKIQNVTAQIGSEAYLDCRIRLLQDKTVTKSKSILVTSVVR